MTATNALATNNIRVLPLVRLSIPGNDVGYHYGGRDFEYNGFTYKANKFLSPIGLDHQLGTQIQSKELMFSNVPDEGSVLSTIESLAWKNALVTLTWLVGELDADQPLFVANTEFYEIHELSMDWSERGDDGSREATIIVTIGPVGTRVRNQGTAKSADADHHYDNDPDDTFFEYTGTVGNWPMEWGQR